MRIGLAIKSSSTVFVILFCAVLLLVLGLGRLPLAVVGAYIVVSTITFFAYYLDKMAAKNNRWRTQEKSLHLLALLGGWPGAWFAQKILRHKSRKQPFLTVFWITVFINCLLLGGLLTTNGTALLTILFDAAS